MHMIKPVAGILILTLVVCAGCGGSDDLGYVEGTVTLDGDPLPNAVVTFQPIEPKGRPSYGRTNDEGWYDVNFTDEAKGAEIAKHSVRISTQDEGDPDADPPIPRSREKVPVNYNTNSELEANVVAGDNVFDFPLKSGGEIVETTDADDDEG
jgi:hypothetical protein